MQIVCFTKLLEDEHNAMAADKTEAQWRLAAGGMAIAASICEVSGAMMEKMPIMSGRVAMGLRTVIKPEIPTVVCALVRCRRRGDYGGVGFVGCT